MADLHPTREELDVRNDQLASANRLLTSDLEQARAELDDLHKAGAVWNTQLRRELREAKAALARLEGVRSLPDRWLESAREWRDEGGHTAIDYAEKLEDCACQLSEALEAAQQPEALVPCPVCGLAIIEGKCAYCLTTETRELGRQAIESAARPREGDE